MFWVGLFLLLGMNGVCFASAVKASEKAFGNDSEALQKKRALAAAIFAMLEQTANPTPDFVSSAAAAGAATPHSTPRPDAPPAAEGSGTVKVPGVGKRSSLEQAFVPSPSPTPSPRPDGTPGVSPRPSDGAVSQESGASHVKHVRFLSALELAEMIDPSPRPAGTPDTSPRPDSASVAAPASAAAAGVDDAKKGAGMMVSKQEKASIVFKDACDGLTQVLHDAETDVKAYCKRAELSTKDCMKNFNDQFEETIPENYFITLDLKLAQLSVLINVWKASPNSQEFDDYGGFFQKIVALINGERKLSRKPELALLMRNITRVFIFYFVSNSGLHASRVMSLSQDIVDLCLKKYIMPLCLG